MCVCYLHVNPGCIDFRLLGSLNASGLCCHCPTCFVEWQGLKTPFIEWKFCTYTVGLSRWQYRFQCINWNPVLLSGNHLTLQKNIVILCHIIFQSNISIYLSTSLPLYLSTYLPIYLPIYLSSFLPIDLPTYLYLPIYLSTNLILYLSTYPPIYLSIYLSLSLSI